VQPELRYARSGELFIAYTTEGVGPTNLIVTTGHFFHLEVAREWPPFGRFMDRLARFSRLTLLDRRGTGLSDGMGATTTVDDAMDDIRAVMDDAGMEQAVLLGGAEGGPMCALFAATFPQRVSALVLIGSFARRLAAPDYPAGYSLAQHEHILGVFEERWGRSPVALREFAPSQADDPAFRSWYARLQRYGASPGSAMAWYRLCGEIDVRHVLPTIRVPTLVVHRSEDMIVPVEHGRHLAARIPGAKYVELPGGGNFWFDDDSETILAEVEEFITGVRPTLTPDRQLFTVLFTDIVGSTRLAAELGDRRWRDLLASHHAVVRRELTRFRGREVKTIGDGFLATFDGPARAIRCASAIRDGVRALGIGIRAGLHTGECELIGEDVGGIAVHIAARVASNAGPHEVLVSSTVRDLVAGSGLRFADQGTHALHGVPEEWRLFAVEG
jgi:class 3 adenylate cyclase